MKNLLIILLLFTINSNAQNYNNAWSTRDVQWHGYVQVGLDLRNATFGSKQTDYKPSLDGQIKLGARANLVDINIFYERFEKINFQAYGVAPMLIFEVMPNIDLGLGLEAGSIIRREGANFLMAGTNVEVRYDLGKYFISLQGNSRLRLDNQTKDGAVPIVNSVMLNVGIKL